MPKIQFNKINLPSFRNIGKNKKFLFILALIIVLGLVVITNNLSKDENKASKKENQALVKKVDQLNSPDVKCDEVIKQIGDVSPDKYDKETQKKLLLQQLNCHSELRNDDQVVSIAHKLKDIYLKEANKEGADEMDLIIRNVQENKSILEQDEKNFSQSPAQ